MFAAPPSGPDLSERLQEVTEALAQSSTQGRVMEVVLPALRGAVQAASSVFLTPGAAQAARTRRLTVVAADPPLLDGIFLCQQTPELAWKTLEDGLPWSFEAANPAADPLPLDPQRTVPVRVSSAVFPVMLDTRPLGVLALEFAQPTELSVAQQRFLRVVASQAATALGRAQGLQQLESRVQERTQQLELQRNALHAFVTFAEAAGTLTDESALAHKALETVQVLFPGCNTSYYLEDGGLWKATHYAGDPTPEITAAITAGLPATSLLIAPALQSGEVYFADAQQIERDALETRGLYGALGVYPLMVDGQVQALLGIGLLHTRVWSDQNRALFRSVGRSLNLAVGRARQASVLQAHRATLEAQAQVLEAFSAFSHDLTVLQEPFAVIRRAQQLILAQLPEGYSVYYELEDGLWRSRAQAGELTPELQQIVDAGRPYHDSQSNVQVWESGEPVYQDRYDPATDAVGLLASHVRATATLPVRVGGQARGVLRVALTGGAGGKDGWTRTERVMLTTLVHQLGTVLAGADQAAALERQRDTLAAQARVLEAFSVFAHDVTQLSSQDEVIRRVQELVLSLLPGGYSVYFERGQHAWELRSWVGDVPAAALEVARRGRPFEQSEHLERPWASGEAFYQDVYDPAADRLGALAGGVRATASVPVKVAGQTTPIGVMSLALVGERQSWTHTDRTVIETMVRNLGLVLDGVRSAELLKRQNALLETQNAQLEAQTRSLQGFNELTRQLSVDADPHALVQRALDGIQTLIPGGYSVYFELEGHQKPEHKNPRQTETGGRWVQKASAGSLENAELRAILEAGIPYASSQMERHWETLQPLYVGSYTPQTAGLSPEFRAQELAMASLPVVVGGQASGLILCLLFAGRLWTDADRAVLESIVRSLGLAIEGARGVEALKRQTVELGRSNAELERFAYIASHDLQEPLRTISSFSDLLQRRYRDQLDPKAQQYLDFIYRGSNQMKALVDDLLTFSRLSAERTRKRRLNLEEPVQEAAQRLSAAIAEAGAVLHAAGLPTVMGDGPQLAQLFQNLIGNAVKFRRPGVPPRIEVRAAQDGQFWHVRVQDNGIGMKPEYFERIFVMFQRLHHRSEYQGTGLGLSICQKIVEQHGGRLWVESQEGEGSIFHFTLPAAANDS